MQRWKRRFEMLVAYGILHFVNSYLKHRSLSSTIPLLQQYSQGSVKLKQTMSRITNNTPLFRDFAELSYSSLYSVGHSYTSVLNCDAFSYLQHVTFGVLCLNCDMQRMLKFTLFIWDLPSFCTFLQCVQGGCKCFWYGVSFRCAMEDVHRV